MTTFQKYAQFLRTQFRLGAASSYIKRNPESQWTAVPEDPCPKWIPPGIPGD